MLVCLMMYMFGVVLVMLTDAQKYLVLREKRGLITHCMHGWSRNMNYVGEMMLYSAIGLLV
jgi:steroid 5-alpha reductase family enzyme